LAGAVVMIALILSKKSRETFPLEVVATRDQIPPFVKVPVELAPPAAIGVTTMTTTPGLVTVGGEGTPPLDLAVILPKVEM
jgi:hypothetical protein